MILLRWWWVLLLKVQVAHAWWGEEEWARTTGVGRRCVSAGVGLRRWVGWSSSTLEEDAALVWLGVWDRGREVACEKEEK